MRVVESTQEVPSLEVMTVIIKGGCVVRWQ